MRLIEITSGISDNWLSSSHFSKFFLFLVWTFRNLLRMSHTSMVLTDETAMPHYVDH